MAELIIHLPEGTVSGQTDREHLAQAIRLLEKKLHSVFMDEYTALLRQAEQMGFSLRGSEPRPRGRAREKAAKSGSGPAVYVHPHDPSRTWSGRGRRPHWLVELGMETVSKASGMTSSPA